MKFKPNTRLNSLKITNARENNLKQISLQIQHDQLVGVTGLSGSGKSSLAFDTVYAEGQRRYIETFSPYTRQFFDKVKKPDADLIENIRPAIAIEQRTRVRSARSTVGSLTDINDYLKIVWSNLAEPFCPVCAKKIESFSVIKVAEWVSERLKQKPTSSFLVCAEILLSSAKSKVKQRELINQELERLKVLGVSRVFNPETRGLQYLENDQELEFVPEGRVFGVLERLRSGSCDLKQLKDSIEHCYTLARRACCIIEISEETLFYHRFAERLLCECGANELKAPKPALFSAQHPLGACQSCKGFGRTLAVDRKLCVPDPNLSINDGAISCWSGKSAKHEMAQLRKFCSNRNISLSQAWRDLDPADCDQIFEHDSKEYYGVLPWFKWLEKKAYKMHVRVFLSRYRTAISCSECKGSRLNASALAYKIDSLSLKDVQELPIEKLLPFFQSLLKRSSQKRALRDVLKALCSRLTYLSQLGLSYLTLAREARTLSGGETQRVNLATALGSELVSTHFVLDEPSVGLHARDTQRLIRAVCDLKDRGNSVLMVEHDLDCLKASDAIIELGPESGAKGGELIFNGPIEDWSGIKIEPKLESHFESNLPVSWPVLNIKNATARNLKGFNLSIPLNSLVAISGPSGSGKSSLIHEVLESAFQRYKLKLNDPKDNLVTGFEHIDQFLLVDQSPIARSPRGNIATYSGIWDTVRDLLASTEKAQELALSRSAFSFNVDQGRCVACSGAGFVREDMQFLSDVYLPCDSCLGKRFQASVLSVEYKGKSVDQLLAISVEEAMQLFATHSKISLLCEVLINLGLGYLRLGHPLSELSGGEAQRLKLVPYIAKDNSQKNLFIFDEPTTGLHAKDVERLIALFKLLRTKGHSIICIEHNLALLTAADWLIDLGPDGGEGGGYLLMQGTPTHFAGNSDSELGSTARFISEFVAQTKPKLRMLRPTRSTAAKQIEIRGAREHNLKNIDIDLPLNTLTAITGVSGSGKSSLAKDIIYAEGQRRYLDCLSPYARQFIKELTKPDIDSIRNILPTICVHQHTFQPGQLSTIATVSEVSNFLRLLLSKCGVQYCPEHPESAISAFSAEQMAEKILAQSQAQTVRILAPIIKLKKGTHKAIFERAIKAEIAEVRVDGIWGRPSLFLEELEKSKPHSIDFVVARFAPKRVAKELLGEAISQALTLGSGTIISVSDQEEKILSTERACAICQRGFFKPDPEDLSFHSRRGSCENCSGQGQIKEKPCPECNASRLKPLGRNVRLAGLNIHELTSFRPSELRKFLTKINFSPRDQAIARPILLELNAKLDLLVKIGLDYLPLFRSAETLSSGELQRLRLSAAMGSPLSGVMFIFDEPSAGLHPLDNQRVISQLISLKERGNSVLVIEHDPSTILAAEHVIEIGPGGGSEGGQVVANQSLQEFLKRDDSPTAKALTTEFELSSGSIESPSKWLRISDASINNIKKLSLNLPLGRLVVVAGVSGAGKSSLLHGLIADQVGTAGGSSWNSARAKISSDIEIARLCLVDQKPIGKNSRSTPASYLGIWDEIRKLFANTLESRARGWSSSFFSYNAGKGRCSECGGMGMVRLEMSFLADAYSNCESCLGKRFSDQALSVKFLDLNPADMLALTFDQAKSIFVNHRRIFSVLSQGCELGLGYLRLGQSSSTLSGGESQRIKLVDELNTKRREHTLYILDEPTTGLHKQDVAKLVSVLRNLRSLGHSVMVIEHDEHVIASADYVIELGPGPAEQGGQVVFEGPPIKLHSANTAWSKILDKT